MLEIYGLEHFLYLLVSFPIFILSIYLIKKYIKTERALRKTVTIVGIIYIIVLVWNRIVTSIYLVGWSHFLPNLYCGISGIALSISMIFLKKDHIAFHCIVYISILGGLLTMIYPDFIVKGSSLFFMPTISGLIHHSLLLFVPIMLIVMGYVKPNVKKYLVLPLGMSLYISLGVFQITVMGYEDAMYIFEPVLQNTMFNWFGLAILFLPAHFLFLFVWQYIPARFIPKDLSEA